MVSFAENFQVSLYSSAQAHVQCVGDQGMADGNFEYPVDRAEFPEVLEVQIVSGVYSQTDLLGTTGSGGVLMEHSVDVAAFEGSGVWFGV